MLRYPGGKSRAVKILSKYLPKNISSICSPFFGGGSFEFYCASELNIPVFGYDSFKPLVEFWQLAITKPILLAKTVSDYHPLSKEEFRKLQSKRFNFNTKLQRAAAFYVLNRTSYSGSTLVGGMASYNGDQNPRFTLSSIERLKNFRIDNLNVKHADYTKSIPKHKDSFLYLDPPYLIESKLYGTREDDKLFNHVKFAKFIKNYDNWMISYNDNWQIRSLYDEYTIISVTWTYGMSKNKNGKEIIIMSKNLK